MKRSDRHRPNRDEFVEAYKHSEEVLGVDEKVSRGVRIAIQRYQKSPLILMMDILNDDEQPWDRRMEAARRAFPHLHRQLDQVASVVVGGDTEPSPGSQGPVINLTVNRSGGG